MNVYLICDQFVYFSSYKYAGFQAYLVGGCVRDLILNKVPKDFDVITTAGLKQVSWCCFYSPFMTKFRKLMSVLFFYFYILLQIKKKFYRSEIIGLRFPICKVHIKGSEVEVCWCC